MSHDGDFEVPGWDENTPPKYNNIYINVLHNSG